MRALAWFTELVDAAASDRRVRDLRGEIDHPGTSGPWRDHLRWELLSEHEHRARKGRSRR